MSKAQPEVEIELRLTLADVYHELGLIEQMKQMALGTVALARSNQDQELALADALVGYLEAFAANLISAGLRLGLGWLF